VTFFFVAMIEICKGIEEPTRMIGYADDYVPYTRHKQPRIAEAKLKKTTDKITKCTSENGFKISADTTLKSLDPIHHKGGRLALGTFQYAGQKTETDFPQKQQRY
jgi:hypothetical protein